MKIISNELGKLTRIYVPDEVRPSGGLNSFELIKLVVDRYKFSVKPDAADAQAKGAIFQSGSIDIGKRRVNIKTLGIYNDGISINTSDTESAEFALNNLEEWLQATFHFRDPITKPINKYENQIVVDFEKPPEKALKIFMEFKKLLERTLNSTYDRKIPMHFLRFGIGVDPSEQTMLAFKGCDFGIERRLGRPYGENRFFSIAPLRTKEHVTLLKAFEEML
jgi:hypothetical protein